MFSRRSGRRRRQSRLSQFGQSIRSHWSHSNVDRVFAAKHGYARRLSVETLEDRRLLTVSSAVLDGTGDAVITGSAAADTITMQLVNIGLATQRLQIVDPAGATAGAGFTQDNATTVSILTSSITGGDIFINSGDDADTIQILATPTGIRTTTNTQNGIPDRVFVGVVAANFNTGTGSLVDLRGDLFSTDSGGSSELHIDNSGNTPDRTWTITTPSAGQGLVTNTVAAAPIVGKIQYTVGDTNTVEFAGGSGAETMNFEFSSALGVTPPNGWKVFGNGGANVVNLSPAAKDLDNLVSRVTFVGGAGTDTLNVFDNNDLVDNTYTVTSTTIDRTGFGGATYDAAVENVNLDAGFDNDTINVNSTSGTATTTVRGNDGNDIFNLQGNALAGANNFSGNAGNDTFNVNIAAATSLTGTSIIINGDLLAGGLSPNQDTVTINDSNAGARAVTFAYQSAASGDVNVSGLGTLLDLNTVEQVNYSGGAANNKTVTVIGTTGNELLTVAPATANSARVFLNGNPVDGPPETSFGATPNLPGVADAGTPSTGPDLFISGATATGIIVQGGGHAVGGADRLYIYAPNEQNIVDASANVIIPGFGVGNAFDTIAVNDTSTSIVNNSVGQLLKVLYNTTDFVQAIPNVAPAVVINSGFEGNPPPTAGLDKADDITVTLSTAYKFQINGGDPDPATTAIVPPDGDQLTLIGPVSPFSVVNVSSTKDPGGGPPIITLDFGGAALPISYSSIENIPPISATTVNLIGDNNDPTVDQSDTFIVKGTGPNAFDLFINHASPLIPLRFNNVKFLNAFGDDQNPPPGTPSVGPNDIDTLEITPYADNTPQGWGIDVFFNEGNPAHADGAKDLLIYHTSAGLGGGGSVSEDIVIQPSGPDNGELRVTNQAFGTPIVVTSYAANTDIVVIDDDGSVTDNDALFLNGTNPNTPQTSGNEVFNVDFDAAGTPAAPMVSVVDQASSTILYQLRSVTGIDTVTFNLHDGNDTFNFKTPAIFGFTSGVAQVNVFGGGGDDLVAVNLDSRDVWHNGRLSVDGGTGTDSMSISGTATFGINTVNYTPGPSAGSGRITHSDGATPDQSIDFINLEPVIDTTVAGTLVVNGNASANAITVAKDPTTADATARGLVSIDGFETMSFNNKTNLVINSLGGDDIVNVNIAAAAVVTGLSTVTVNANDGNDTVRFQNLSTAAGFTSATVNAGAGNDTIDASNIPITTTKPLTLNGEEGNDTITGGPGVDTISGGAGDDTIIDSPGATAGVGDTIDGGTGNDIFDIRGTILNDIITVSQLAPSAVVAANYQLSVINGSLAAPPAAITKNIVPQNTGLAPSDPANLPSIELILVEALRGDDVVAISQADAYSNTVAADGAGAATDGIAAQTIAVQVIGDSPNASDRLVVRDEGKGDLVIHRQAPDGRSGSIVVGGMAPISYDTIERVDITPIDNAGRTGTDALGRLIVFHYDNFESNDSITNATPLGVTPIFVGLRNIDPGGIVLPPPLGSVPGDADWYEFRPGKIGTFQVQALFEHIVAVSNGRTGLPGNGDLRLDVFRADGTLIASSDSSAPTPLNVNSSESISFSVAKNTSYFVRVQGATAAAINNYDLNVTEVDLGGPQVFDPDGPGSPRQALFPNNLPTFDLFAPKNNLAAGATPQVFSLTVNIRDLPDPRLPGDPYPALDPIGAAQAGLYSLVGDHVGNIAVQSVNLVHNYQFTSLISTTGNASTFTAAGLLASPFIASQLAGSGVNPFVGDTIIFQDGPAATQQRTITAFNPITGQITLDSPLPAVPVAGNSFQITSFPEAQVVLNFARPLPDDRFSLTLLDNIIDPAGNRLDGESNADEPQIPTFPSGNGFAGGNFVARFTVDTRPELGTAVAQDIDVDINGNYYWDPTNNQIGNDATNVDLSFTLAVQNTVGTNHFIAPGAFNVNDLSFEGKFTNPAAGATLPNRLYDTLGTYGVAQDLGGIQRWMIDINGDGVITMPTAAYADAPPTPGNDIIRTQPSLGSAFTVAGAIPVVGNFSAAHPGDEIGLYYGGKWGLDFNADFVISANEIINDGLLGAPIVGDFDGDGLDDLAVFNNNQFSIDFAAGGFFSGVNTVITWGFPGTLDRPIAADIDQDGIDDLGLWEPRNSASLPREVSEWYFLVSGTPTAPITRDPILTNSATTTTQVFATNLIGRGVAVGDEIRFLSGANFGQVRTVTSFTEAGANAGLVTFTGALSSAPAVGDIIAVGGRPGLTLDDHAFRPTPFGNDITAEFGDELALPMIGNLDPPATPTIVAGSTGVSGDYNNSGQVNSTDYTVWRGTYGSSNLLADGNHSGQVDAGDFVLWRKSISAGGAGSSLADSPAGTALDVDSPPTVSGASAAAAALEASATSYISNSILVTADASLGATPTIDTVSDAAPKAAEHTANIAVLDRAFETVAQSPKEVVRTLTPPAPSTFDDTLLLLDVADYGQRPTSLPAFDLNEDGATSDDAIDSALSDFAADSVLELAV